MSLLGIDASGTALLETFAGCSGAGGSTSCYEEFSDGSLTYRSGAAPANFVVQNGTPCPTLTGLSAAGRSVCNGTYQVAGGYLGDQQGVWESYPGSPQPGDFIYSGSADVLLVNAAGDFLVTDGSRDDVYQVIVSQTPEPSSLLLLATGAAALAGTARRRLISR